VIARAIAVAAIMIELVATTPVEEPVAPMDGRDRHEHDTGDRGCTERSEQTESEKRAASELRESDDYSM
jgi:hypothetical protein